MNNDKQVETEWKGGVLYSNDLGLITVESVTFWWTEKVESRIQTAILPALDLLNGNNTYADVHTCCSGYQMICINTYMAYKDQS